MQDHIFYDIAYRVNSITLIAVSNNPAFAAEQAELYNDKAVGIYTSPTTDSIGWENIPASLRNNWSNETKNGLAAYFADWPEVEYIAVLSYLEDLQNSQSPGPNDGFNYASLAAVLVAPRSRGTSLLPAPTPALPRSSNLIT